MYMIIKCSRLKVQNVPLCIHIQTHFIHMCICNLSNYYQRSFTSNHTTTAKPTKTRIVISDPISYLPTYLVPCYRVCLQLWSWYIHYGFPSPSYHMEACLVKAPKDLRENSGRLHSRNVYIPNERGVWAVPSLLAVDANPLFPHSHPLSIFHQSFELVLTRWKSLQYSYFSLPVNPLSWFS